MIFVTGDCHGDFSRFRNKYFPLKKDLTKNDYVIITGDFGGIWNYGGEDDEEKYWLDWINDANFTTLFVDGNHENMNRLYNYETIDWHGGKVHKIRDSVFHLMRGEVFNIDGKKIFTFGGASSHDIDDGILDIDDTETIYRYRKLGKFFRIRDYSWWEQELPTKEEMENGLSNLEKVNYKVDYIISHCAPTNIQKLIIYTNCKPDYLTDYLQTIAEKCKFKKWYFGHYHDYIQFDSKYQLLYKEIIQLK